jgi:hypothetical protein
MTSIRILATALAACAVSAVAAFAAKPAPATVSIALTPTAITFGSGATVSGTTSPNTVVTLRADAFPFNGSFAQVAKATSDAAGNYSFRVAPDSNTQYRAEVRKARSPVATLSVRWKVTRSVSTTHPKRGTRVRFSGTVSPAHNGGTVALQKRKSGVFKTIATTTLTAATTTSSHYSLRVRVRANGTYRTLVAGDGAHATGHSRNVKLVVH